MRTLGCAKQRGRDVKKKMGMVEQAKVNLRRPPQQVARFRHRVGGTATTHRAVHKRERAKQCFDPTIIISVPLCLRGELSLHSGAAALHECTKQALPARVGFGL